MNEVDWGNEARRPPLKRDNDLNFDGHGFPPAIKSRLSREVMEAKWVCSAKQLVASWLRSLGHTVISDYDGLVLPNGRVEVQRQLFATLRYSIEPPKDKAAGVVSVNSKLTHCLVVSPKQLVSYDEISGKYVLDPKATKCYALTIKVGAMV